MAIRFTPGPWLFNPITAVVHKDDQIGFFQIADCSNPVRLSVEEMNANAAIISCAPCMIAELDRSHALLNALWDVIPDANTKNKIMDQLAANSRVLAKARGEL